MLYAILTVLAGFVIICMFAPSKEQKKNETNAGEFVGGLLSLLGTGWLAISLLAIPYGWVFGSDKPTTSTGLNMEKTQVLRLTKNSHNGLKSGYGTKKQAPDKEVTPITEPVESSVQLTHRGPSALGQACKILIESYLDFTAVDAAGGLRPRSRHSIVSDFGEPDQIIPVDGLGFIYNWTRHVFVDRTNNDEYRNLKIIMDVDEVAAWTNGTALLE